MANPAKPSGKSDFSMTAAAKAKRERERIKFREKMGVGKGSGKTVGPKAKASGGSAAKRAWEKAGFGSLSAYNNYLNTQKKYGDPKKKR